MGGVILFFVVLLGQSLFWARVRARVDLAGTDLPNRRVLNFLETTRQYIANEDY